jgi:hypothetical protein
MKKGFGVFLSVLLLFVCCVPAFSQPSSKSVETFVMDNFDKGQDWTWTVRSSRFVAEGYPKTGLFDGIPAPLKPLRHEGDPDPKVFGIKTAYNRKGDNWFELYPAKNDKPYEIPFVGVVSQIDFWVWGANYQYYLDVLVRDAEGRVHTLPTGSLAFKGWRNVIVNIPGWICQSSKLRSGPKNMTFVGFRVRSDPDESVDDFMIYFDQIKYATNSLEPVFDGFELQNTDFSNTSKSSSDKTSTGVKSADADTAASGGTAKEGK